MRFTQREAQAIAAKLDAEIRKGRKHDRVNIRYGGHLIAFYGIRKSSKPVPHDYIPHQLHVTNGQAGDLVKCPLDKAGYFAILREQGRLPEEN